MGSRKKSASPQKERAKPKAKPKHKAIRVIFTNGATKTVTMENIKKGISTDPREYLTGPRLKNVKRIEEVEV